MAEADWEKRLKEFLKPVKVEWEESLKELSREVDEVERIRGELKGKYGVEQKGPGDPVPAKEWREMSSDEILNSIDVAVRVLAGRKLDAGQKKFANELAKDLIDIALDPPEGDAEEEYERVRERAKLVRGPKLV